MKVEKNIYIRLPFLPLLLSAIIGILAGKYLLNFQMSGVISIIFFLITAISFFLKFQYVKYPGLLLTILFLFSFYYSYKQTSDIAQQNIFNNLEKTPIIARGFLLDVPLPLNYSNISNDSIEYEDTDEYFEFEYSLSDLYCFRFQVTEYFDGQNSKKCNETILVISKNGYPDLPTQRKIALPVRVHIPTKPQNPGEFDFSKYQRELGIMRYADFDNNHGFEILTSSVFERFNPKRLAANVRASITKLALKLPSNDSSLFLTLTIGNTTMLTRDTRDVFRHTGTLHLLVISGLHIGFLVLIAEIILRLFHINLRAKAVILLLLLIFYWLIVGYKISITRAVIIGVLYYLGQLCNRRTNFSNILASAAFFILIINPYELFHIGFYLTFSAVFFITFIMRDLNRVQLFSDDSIYFLTRFQKLRNLIRDYISKSVKLTFAGVVGTTPIIWWKFGIITPGAFISNLFAIPLMLWILGFSMLVFTLQIFLTLINSVLFEFGYEIFFTDFVNNVSLYLTKASCLGIDLLLRLEKLVLEIPGCYYFLPKLSFITTVLIYAYFILIIFRKRFKIRFKTTSIIFSFVLMVLAFEFFWSFNTQSTFTFTQLSGKYKSCSIIQTSDDETIIHDPGTLEYQSNARKLVSILNNQDVKSIEALIIQSSKLDAIDGYIYILKQLKVKSVFFSNTFAKSFAGELLIWKLEKANINYFIVGAGTTISGFKDVSFRFISPPSDFQEEVRVKYDPSFTLSTIIEGDFGNILISGYSSDINYDANINYLNNHKGLTGKTKLLILPAKVNSSKIFDRWLKYFKPSIIVSSSHNKISENEREIIIENSDMFIVTKETGAFTYSYFYEDKRETTDTFFKID